MSQRTQALQSVADDGMYVDEVGEYARTKYALLYGYASIFSTSMKSKWPNRIYIDLFSGAGKARLKTSNSLVRTSPLLALSVPDTFSHYVFCEKEAGHLRDLKCRVEAEHPLEQCVFIEGDANDEVERILGSIPRRTEEGGALCFCFVDPYRMADLKFATLEALSERYMDFLVLVPTEMEFARFARQRYESDDVGVSGFTGDSDWRTKWAKAELKGVPPERFLLELLDERMASIGRPHGGAKHARAIVEPTKNRILYHLAFYSRHELGMRFFKEATKYCTPQGELSFD